MNLPPSMQYRLANMCELSHCGRDDVEVPSRAVRTCRSLRPRVQCRVSLVRICCWRRPWLRRARAWGMQSAHRPALCGREL